MSAFPSDDTVITVSHLRKAYRDKVAVADVSLSVRRGEVVGLLGRNGAGKTTTVECIAGLRAPDDGVIRVLGLDPAEAGLALRERLALQLQESELPARLTVREALDLYASFYTNPADVDGLLRDLGLADKEHAQFARLSGGQRQRLSIALALVGNPEVAILDELTTGLDPQARRDTWAVIERVRDRGVTILLVTHFMEEAERLCDRIVLIDDGLVVASGTPTELATAAAEGVVLRFRVPGGVPEGLVERAAGAATVQVSPDGRVEVRGGEATVQDVLTALSTAGLRAVDLRLERGSLEDAFVALTAHSLEV